MLLQVLQQRAAGRMNDALGNARGAGGEEHIERVAERQTLEGERLGFKRSDEVLERHAIGN
ncbi:hypothetical protein D3C87_2184320 [compost metagenome]